MQCTEDEAKQYWCPFTRVIASGGIGNRLEENPVPKFATCVGSKCMLWMQTDSKKGTGYCGAGNTPEVKYHQQQSSDTKSKSNKRPKSGNPKVGQQAEDSNGGESRNEANKKDSDGTE